MLSKLLLILILTLTICSFSLFKTDFQEETQLKTRYQKKEYQEYLDWKQKFFKNTNGNEDQLRFKIFQENKAYIEKHNNSNKSVKLGLTKFADMTNTEFRQFIESQNAKITILPDQENSNKKYKEFKGGESINWVANGAVTNVKDEGQCGACWAFAAVGALEGLKVVQGGSLESLSEEQVIDCDETSFGCNGGFIESAFDYTAKYGIESAASYPYEHNGQQVQKLDCKYNKNLVVFQNSGYEEVPTQSPDDMYKALQVQPLVATIDAASLQFQLYQSGVIEDQNCGKALNFTLNIVGYNNLGNFWTLKNLWGTNWGMQGFVNIKATYGSGICGINEQVSYPI